MIGRVYSFWAGMEGATEHPILAEQFKRLTWTVTKRERDVHCDYIFVWELEMDIFALSTKGTVLNTINKLPEEVFS